MKQNNAKASEWAVGERVAFYNHHGNLPSAIKTIDKIHKNGNVIVDGQQYRSFGDGYALQTGHENSWSRSSIRRLTPAIEADARKAAKMARMKRLGDWLSRAEHDAISDDLLSSLLVEHNTHTAMLATRNNNGKDNG